MNIFRRAALRLALKGVDLSLTNPQGWELLTGGDTWSKVKVGEATQLQITAAYSAIRLISETVGTLPLHIYQKTAKGRVKATNHALYDLVHHQPNEYMTPIEWKESMAVSLATMGVSYNLTTRFASTGRVVSIQPIHKTRCRPKVLTDGSVVYVYSDARGQTRELKRADVCPIRGFGNVGQLEGFAPHQLHANSLAFTSAIEKYGAEFFGSGGHPKGVLRTEASFNPEQRQTIREQFNKYVRESWASGQLPILEKSLKYDPIHTKNNEAQFIETRKLQIAEVARIYRTPLHMLMEMDKASYNNSEQANKHFLDYTLMPYLVRIEQGLNSSLLNAEDRRKGHYFEFDVRGLLRGDSTQRSQYYVSMRMAGAMTQNEIRELENMDRHDGADDLHVPLNMAPSDLLRQIQTPTKD
jgi:HK97 family phage portal protein